MKRAAIRTVFAVWVLGLSWALAQEARPPKHLADARDMVTHLDLKNTNYEHGEGHVTWTGTPALHADCSGFVDALLMHSYGYDRPTFKMWFDSQRPTAARYHDAIVAQHGFIEVKRVQDARPGDFLAVKYLQRTDNTGHIMLVANAPRPMRPKKPAVAGADQWEVTVIDSSRTGHGSTDTRHAKGLNGKDHDGLGQGVFRIYADKPGQVVGFTWSTLDASEFKKPADEHLVIGRLKVNFKP